jgi:hypothetical protein
VTKSKIIHKAFSSGGYCPDPDAREHWTACGLGSGNREFCEYEATTVNSKVTCKSCLKILAKQKRSKETAT